MNRLFAGLASLPVFFLIHSCSSGLQANRIETQQYAVSEKVPGKSDSTTAAFILPYRNRLDSMLGNVILYSAQAIEKKKPEGLLGDLVADACFSVGNQYANEHHLLQADGAILNHGGLRAPLPQGPVTVKHLYELMPFENELVILDLDSATLWSWLSDIAVHGGAPVSGLRLTIKKDQLTAVQFNTAQKGRNKYRIITSDYLANGGDNLTFLKGVGRSSTQIKVREAIQQYLEQQRLLNDTLKLTLDGRIQLVD